MEGLSHLPIAPDGPDPSENGVEGESLEVGQEVVEGTTFEIEGTHHLDEIAEGIQKSDGLRPLRHTGDGSQQTTQ